MKTRTLEIAGKNGNKMFYREFTGCVNIIKISVKDKNGKTLNSNEEILKSRQYSVKAKY